MHIIGLLLFSYFYLGIKKHNDNYPIPTNGQLCTILINVLLAEVGFYYVSNYFPFSDSFSILNVVLFFIVQDIYFYSVHRLFHEYLYFLHKKHHEVYGPIFAWHAYFLDHIMVNLASIGIPLYLFPNTYWFTVFVIFLEVYSSVNGHTKNELHIVHHKDVTKRLGSFYIIDRLVGSY